MVSKRRPFQVVSWRMSDTLQPRLGQALQAARQRLGLTQEQVARAVGLVPAAYGRIERGNVLPGVGNLWRLCALLGVSSDTLLALSVADAPDADPPPKRKKPRGPGKRRERSGARRK